MSESSKWIERAKETRKFHRSKILTDEKWTIQQTAKALRRSLGGICEDLLIAKWLKTHETKLERFDYAYQALEFIRDKQREDDLDEIE